MISYISNSLNDTKKISKKISKNIEKGSIIALYGDVGTGKTTFTSFLLKELGCKDIVTSPTFSLINEYNTNISDVAHFDMYRITSIDDLYSIGFYDYINSDKILIIEWSENIKSELYDNIIRISIKKIDETTREFLIDGVNI